ncbi:hypothetical protein [Nocardiopsis composta]|uniref:Uncharacterized protein n=1 Tax=Nocardiopsis composta TaxID=157465 RepID=A0A7W8VH78_9ACTN|nr:hypothetical protein [Nocardiopsis composta]MBB5436332.1 hypothetical protein [Nocardiopsis composta]
MAPHASGPAPAEDPAPRPPRGRRARTRSSPPPFPPTPELLELIAAAAVLAGSTGRLADRSVVHRIKGHMWHGTPTARPVCGAGGDPTRLRSAPGPVTCKRCARDEPHRSTQQELFPAAEAMRAGARRAGVPPPRAG